MDLLLEFADDDNGEDKCEISNQSGSEPTLSENNDINDKDPTTFEPELAPIEAVLLSNEATPAETSSSDEQPVELTPLSDTALQEPEKEKTPEESIHSSIQDLLEDDPLRTKKGRRKRKAIIQSDSEDDLESLGKQKKHRLDESDETETGAPIRLRVIEPQGNLLLFKIRTDTQLRRLMKAYCERMGVKRRSVRFTFDGSHIDARSTPKELEMIDGDVIEVFWEQTGGAECIHRTTVD